MAVVRVREHVNPLSRRYQVPTAPPDWSQIYADPGQPLQLDIGCGRGRFLLQMAPLEPRWNFLGLEIREPLVAQANSWRSELGYPNLHYLFCNANTSIAPLLNSLPTGVLQRVSIQFPDPWFKRKHQKRRVLQPELITSLLPHLRAGGLIFIQSDVRDVAEEMYDRLATHSELQPAPPGKWLAANPMPIATEREQSTLDRGEPVYRALFTRS